MPEESVETGNENCDTLLFASDIISVQNALFCGESFGKNQCFISSSRSVSGTGPLILKLEC